MEITNYCKCEPFANPYVVKCVLLGRHGVGKSTMGRMLTEGRFDPMIESTIGIDFFIKTIKLAKYNNHSIKLQIWDTAGQEKFKSIVKSYLRDVCIVFIMFDLTNRESWNEIEIWKREIEEYSKQFEGIPRVVLVGTKSDKKNHVIAKKEIETKAEEWECNYYILSSKNFNSQTMIYRMFSLEAEGLHGDILYNHVNGKELPFGVLEKDNKNLNKVYYCDSDKPNWCCFQ